VGLLAVVGLVFLASIVGAFTVWMRALGPSTGGRTGGGAGQGPEGGRTGRGSGNRGRKASLKVVSFAGAQLD